LERRSALKPEEGVVTHRDGNRHWAHKKRFSGITASVVAEGNNLKH
jgi:hypothetical protein